MRVAIITANTDIYRDREENESGEVIKKIVEEAGLEIVFMRALPTDRKVLSTVMQRMADNHLTDLILTTGAQDAVLWTARRRQPWTLLKDLF